LIEKAVGVGVEICSRATGISTVEGARFSGEVASFMMDEV
jgi:hypothetical protein